MSEHRDLSAERRRRFTFSQQILSIAAEMLRGRTAMQWGQHEALRLAYERALRLVDLTVEVNEGRSLRCEMLRWREVIAALYLLQGADPKRHEQALRVLFLFSPQSAQQIACSRPSIAPITTRAGSF